MKKWIVSAIFCLTLLSACSPDIDPGPQQVTEPLPEGEAVITCRVVTNDEGVLLLAQVDGRATDLYYLTATDLPMAFEDPDVTEIEPGALLEIQYGGDIMETYPAQLGAVTSFVVKADGFDDRCALYLQAMLDLAAEDSALDADVTYLGVDLSETTLAPSEAAAVAWAFSNCRDLPLLEGTWEELAEQGYIDREELYWEDGVLYSITEQEADRLTFTVGKWRSGLGALYFTDCTSSRDESGHWSEYAVGAVAIS